MTMRDDAPVRDARNVPDHTKLLLYVRAGGRCEFDGCNEYLLEHHVTLDAVNVGQLAHIVAFKERGPRGDDPARPVDINDAANLMLLCHRCHTEIDNRETGAKFSREILDGFKRDHEARIFHLTGRKSQRKTTIVEIRAKIGGQVTAIPEAQIWDAVTPMYPAGREWCVIDLTTFDDDSAEYYAVARRAIEDELRHVYSRGGGRDLPTHISVFGLAPIPLLVFFGSQLSNKGPVELFQKHRDTQDWSWKTDGAPVGYEFRAIRRGSDATRVALVLSLSASLDLTRLPPMIDETYSVYEITLVNTTPNPLFLRRREDLAAFRSVYHEAHAAILRDHGSLTSIDVFPAVPAPIAVACGFELFPKVSPTLRVYDHDQRRGGWVHALDVGRAG